MLFEKEKNLFVLMLLIVVAIFLIDPQIVFAEGEIVPIRGLFDPMAGVVYQALTSIGGLFAWLGGTLLNISLSMFVFNLPLTLKELGLMEVISYVWKIVRDLFNLLFIFGLTWIGFRFILGLDVNGAKRNLGTLLVAALLINFSLFATQLIIDVGNVAAAEIGDLFTPAEGSKTQKLFDIDIVDISTNFIAATDIKNIGDNTLAMSGFIATGEERPTGNETALGLGDALAMGLTITILLILLGFVFAAGAFLMFARALYLIFLMMFSPVMFLGFVLPKMEKISKDWWHQLINQTLVGPAYIFMLLIALRVLDTLMGKSGGSEVNTWVFIMSSLLVAAFAWASLVVAKKFGALGATTSMNFAGSAFAGGAAAMARGSAGRAFQGLSESRWLRNKAAEKSPRGWMARRVFNTSSKLGDASFDVRNVAGVGKKIGAGEGRKGGYATVTKEIADKEKAFADRLGTVDDKDERVSALQLEVEAAEQAMESKRKKIKEEQDEITRLERAKAAAATPADKESIQDQINVKKAEINSYRTEVEKHKEDVDKRKEDVQTEKFRRQVGKIPPATAATLKTMRDDIKAKLVAYEAETVPADKETKRAEIARLKKDLATAEKAAKKEAGGYAFTVENKGLISNIFLGRDKNQNQNAGKEIRKAYKDKAKSKDK
ncbi:MAG: hypothetical protein WDZ56_00145 [Candidatus Paceibacterota bacterium]